MDIVVIFLKLQGGEADFNRPIIQTLFLLPQALLALTLTW